MKNKLVLDTVEAMRDDIIDLLKEAISSEPVNPIYDKTGKRSELKCSKIFSDKMKNMGLSPIEFDIDLDELEEFKGGPGYIEGFTDKMDFKNRPNILAKFPGKNPDKAKSILLTGHLDVVAADEVDNWKFNPFTPTIEDGYIWGRGSVDMLGGFVAMVAAVEALQKAEIELDGDIWLAAIVSEEAGGTGGLAMANYLKNMGANIDIGIMGEPTDLDASLLCRGIQKLDVVVHGVTGHLEVKQPHWSEGGPVDAIQKGRYILNAVDELNREWALRSDKNHPLLPSLPCQIKTSMVEGGHQRSSYPDYCKLSFNIQVLPSETNEKGLGEKTKKEFTDFMNKVFDSDPWLSINRPEINWISESDCSEVPVDHPFVGYFLEQAKKVHPQIKLTGSGFHTDTGWFERLAKTPTINFGPGDPSLAHFDNEKCKVEDIIKATKIIALTCIKWCNIENA